MQKCDCRRGVAGSKTGYMIALCTGAVKSMELTFQACKKSFGVLYRLKGLSAMIHQHCVVVSKRFLDMCYVETAHIFEERSTITCLTGNYCAIYIETVTVTYGISNLGNTNKFVSCSCCFLYTEGKISLGLMTSSPTNTQNDKAAKRSTATWESATSF